MLAALFAPAVISAIFSAGVDLFKQYQQGKITLEELRTKLGVIALQEGTKWEQANTDMVKQTYGDFSRMVMSSRIVQSCYTFVVVTQTCVLIWAQIGVPWLVWRYGGTYPSSGVTLDWGYALLVLLLGGGIAAIRRPRQPGGQK